MFAIGYKDLQPLLAQFTGEGMMLSCYADLGVSESFRHNWELDLAGEVEKIRKAIGKDDRILREFDKNIAAVRDALESRTISDTRWVAVFSAAQRHFLMTIPLEVDVGTTLVLDRAPYLVPLLAAIHRRKEYLAIHTDTHRGRIFATTPGAIQLVAEFDEDVPQHQRSVGEREGFGQSAIARHREDRMMHYRKDLIREVEKLWEERPFAGIILLGEHEVLEHVRSALPSRLRNRVLREVPESWYEGVPQTEEKIRSIAAELFAEQASEVVPGFWDLLKDGQSVAKGPRATIAAIQSGQLGPAGKGYLVFGPDPMEAAGRCIACRTLTDDPVGKCPKCQAPCAPGNLWEELLITALQHKISAHFVRDPKKLAEYGGVVAVLPRKKRS